MRLRKTHGHIARKWVTQNVALQHSSPDSQTNGAQERCLQKDI